MKDNLIRGIIGDSFITEILVTAFARNVTIGKNLSNLYIACQSKERRDYFRENYNIKAVTDANIFLPKVKVLVLAFQTGEDCEKIISEIAPVVPKGTLIISCTYGLKIATLEKFFPNSPVIRIVMNPTIITGNGICVYFVGSVNPTDAEAIAQLILTQVGETIKMASEEELELAAELILSGTIFSFAVANALTACGVKNNLPVDKSIKISSQILSGVAKTVADSDDTVKSIVKGLQNQNKFFELGKTLIEKYKILQSLQDSFHV